MWSAQSERWQVRQDNVLFWGTQQNFVWYWEIMLENSLHCYVSSGGHFYRSDMNEERNEGEAGGPRRSARHHASSRCLDAAPSTAPAPPGKGRPRKEVAPPAPSGCPRNELQPGLRYLLEELTQTLMKKCGENKPKAEERIKQKWASLTPHEQNFWNRAQIDSKSTVDAGIDMQVEI